VCDTSIGAVRTKYGHHNAIIMLCVLQLMRVIPMHTHTHTHTRTVINGAQPISFFLCDFQVGRRPLLCAQDPQVFCAVLLCTFRGYPMRLFCFARPRF